MPNQNSPTDIQDVAAVLTEQRNAALNQVAEVAIQLRKVMRENEELKRKIAKTGNPGLKEVK